MNIKNNAINLSEALGQNFDMSSREGKILKNISKLTGFAPKLNIWRSSYWGKNLGASHWLGDYLDKKAVLKIQGAKPDISEINMINEFSKQNQSKLIRPPEILETIKWNDSNGFEALIEDYASGGKVVSDGKIVSQKEISEFMNYYSEYRKKCIPKMPWLSIPPVESDWSILLDKLITNSVSAFPKHAFRDSQDINLAKEAYEVLQKAYKDIQLEFMHGHFSCKDLIYRDSGSKEVVLFSNLFWKWRYPYFDAVFAYHWFMYELANINGITPTHVEDQRKIWLNEIYKVTGANKSLKTRILVNAALLERAVAGFIIDSFLCDPKKKISKYLYDSTKSEALRLIEELSRV